MLTDAQRSALDAAWGPAREAGVLGSVSIEELWEHTAGYASAVCSAFSDECSTWNGSIIDVGTGCGVPGVLLAAQLPNARVSLVDAAERRLIHVRRAVQALDLPDRALVVHGRGDDLAHDREHRGKYDVAVARLLADPAETVEQLLPLVRVGGAVVISVANADVSRCLAADLSAVGGGDAAFEAVRSGQLAVFRRVAEGGSAFPRRVAVRRRTPLF